MASDVNVVILSGVVQNTPSEIRTKQNKKICLFTLKVVERFVLADGSKKEHNNFLTIEALGKNAEKYLTDVQKGDRCLITGYLRQDDLDGVEQNRIRAYNLQKE